MCFEVLQAFSTHLTVSKAIELVHEIAEYQSQRYPNIFAVTRHNSHKGTSPVGWNDGPPIKEITILPLNTSYELPLEITYTNSVKAMEIASLL